MLLPNADETTPKKSSFEMEKRLMLLRGSILDLILFTAYTVGSATSLLLIKCWLEPAKTAYNSGANFLGPVFFVTIGTFLYVVSFLIWMIILARNELTIAYPIAIGLTLVTSTLGAMIILGESVSFIRVSGMILILFGIGLVVRH